MSLLKSLRKLCKKLVINSSCECCNEDIKIEDIEKVREELDKVLKLLQEKKEKELTNSK